MVCVDVYPAGVGPGYIFTGMENEFVVSHHHRDIQKTGLAVIGDAKTSREILGAVWRRLSVEERRHPLDWIDLNVGGPVVQPTIDGDFLEGDRKRGVLAVVGSRRGRKAGHDRQ
jgi:hypothetical protein